MDYPELELGLHRHDAASYSIQVRYRDPSQEAEQRAEVYPVRFDLSELKTLETDTQAYGQFLGKQLLDPPDVRSCLDKAITAAQLSERRLRFRLWIDRWSLELHGLRWEALRDPQTDRSLLMDEKILFSRFLGSFDMRPVRLRAKSQLRALVMIANPSDLEEWKPGGQALAPVDVEGELQRVTRSMEGISITTLAGAKRATLAAIGQALRDEYDVFYLVCHGALIDDEPRLWLEDEAGHTKVTSGTELVDVMSRLSQLPRLMILASCQSAGDGKDASSRDGGVLSALGPRLAEAGIPGVIAMQGNVQQRTIAEFMPVFFRELCQDGQIDRAMAEARFSIRDLPDYWVPVLYTRLITGRLWYQQRFSKQDDFEIWDGLLDQIREGNLVPILGGGLWEPFVGSLSDVSRNWAIKRQYPLAAALQGQLHHVAQYISTTQGKAFALNDCVRELNEELVDRWPELSEEAENPNEPPNKRLLRLSSEARKLYLNKHTVEAHQILASLNCPLYLTTNRGNLLTDALRECGKEPHEEHPLWQEDDAFSDSPDMPLVPTVENPLLIYLFGHLNDKRSVVLTEDDFFEYMIGMSRLNNRRQPSVLQEKLTDAGLMFLGFRIDDWEFRVLIHLLRSLQGSKLRGFYKNVAVQLDPEEGRGSDLARTRKYLEKYFNAPAMQIEIYWGSAEEFLKELDERWKSQN